MKKYLIKIILFFVLVAVIDVVCGFCFNVLKQNAKGGDTRKNYYIAEKCSDDILVLGSSRAARHYAPKVIEASFGGTCYNAGEPGCGIITAYARYGMVAERRPPKMVIYEVSPRFDYFKGDDNSKYLGRVRQYADKPVVKAMSLDLSDHLECLRLLSNMYKNNSFIVQNVMDNLMGKDNKGFEPLKGEMKAGKKYTHEVAQQPEIDSVKLSYMERLIVELQQQDVKVCFMVSPKAISPEEAAKEEGEYEPIISLCQQYGVPFVNHIYMEGISDHREYFHDFVHFNRDGAARYTEIMCEELKSVWKRPSNFLKRI